MGQVGDGAVIIRNGDAGLESLSHGSGEEYVNETTFLTSPGAIDCMHVQVWRGAASGLAVFTDGLERLALKMPSGDPHAPFFKPLFEFCEQPLEPFEAYQQLEAFLHSPRVAERTEDDLTLLLATRI